MSDDIEVGIEIEIEIEIYGGLSRKSPAIVNITRTVCATLM